jgi:hypothetical protein
MSSPISAIITCAAVGPTPGDLIKPVDRLVERGYQLGDLGLDGGEVGAGLVDPGQHGAQQEGGGR